MGWLRRLICVAAVAVAGTSISIGAGPTTSPDGAQDKLQQLADKLGEAMTGTPPTTKPARPPELIVTTQPGPNIPDGRPILQLAVQVPDGTLTSYQKHVGDLLIRELQRQAVLIAARDELGIRTRDMTLDEPFTRTGSGGVTTILETTKVRPDGKGLSATISLGVGPVTTSRDPYAIIDVPVADKRVGNRFSHADHFPTADVPDYTLLVSSLESASRDAFPTGLKATPVMCGTEADPTRWADDTGADSAADQLAESPDVFHQYLVVREMHRQMRESGASYQRVDRLVRAYANLAQLSSAQWSWAIDAFTARSLLYAQRLVVHEKSSPRSLYTRAYARAVAGIHAAALDDLTKADDARQEPPAWARMVRGICKYDLDSLVELSTTGPWEYRGLASMYLSEVAGDGYPGATVEAVTTRVIADQPGLLFIPELNPNVQYGAMATASIAIVLRNAVSDSSLPPDVKAIAASLPAAALMDTRADGYANVGRLRDQIGSAALTDRVEPSYGVLSGLIEQQSFAAIVRRAAIDCSGFASGNQNPVGNNSSDVDGLQQYARLAHPILAKHPWGVLVPKLKNNASPTPDKDFEAVITGLSPRDNGWWIDIINSHIVLNDAEQKKLDENWIFPGHRLAAMTPCQYGYTTEGRGSVGVDSEPLWAAMHQSSPYCANLASWWLLSVPKDRWLSDGPMFDRAMTEVSDRFVNRPDLIDNAADLCDLRGDFDRSFDLLSKLSLAAPSSHVYDRMARVARHQGRKDQALACIDRGLRIAPTENYTNSNSGSLAVLKARIEADGGDYDSALTTLGKIESGMYTADNTYLYLQSRCYEATGNFDSAESCMRAVSSNNLPWLYETYFFARRLNRPDIDSLHKAALAQVGEQVEPKVMMLIADGNDAKALDAIKEQGNLSWSLQLERLVLAARLKKPDQVRAAIDSVSPYNLLLGRVLKQVVDGKDLPAALKQFDDFEARQLNSEDLVKYDSAMGRYLIAAGYKAEGTQYLARALRRPDHEQDGYFFAWEAVGQLGLDPTELAAAPK